MRARCPNCRTLFRLAIEDLELAGGLVRCGQCLCVFHATPEDRGADQQWFESPEAEPEPAPEPEPVAPETAVPGAEAAAEPGADDEDARSASAAYPPLMAERGLPRRGRLFDAEDPLAPAGQPQREAPSLLLHGLAEDGDAPAPPRRRWNRPLMLASLVTLSVLAAMQLAWHQRQALLASPTLRPLLVGSCQVLGCNLPERRDLDSIQLLDRSVASHPNIADALIISATMVNNADFVQPYPLLVVTMSDIRGQVVARRHFHATDYLNADIPADGMVPGAPLTAILEVTDPGGEALTFELEFY